MGAMTIVVCVCLYFFPDVHAKAVLAAEQQMKEEYTGDNAALVSVSASDVVEQDKGLDAQLEIGLPQSLSEEQIQIENDYVTQTVYIRFAHGVADYFEDYRIRGSSDHIAALSY